MAELTSKVNSGLQSICQWLVILGLCLPVLVSCHSATDLNNRGSITLRQAMGDDISGNYARAYKPRDFSFPRDHAAHPEFRHEWWYFTGNLQATTGERFGYELTVFRIALNPPPENNASSNIVISSNTPEAKNMSSWRANNIYMAHLAVTDIDNKQFHYAERFSRDALGLAGARVFYREQIDSESRHFRIWLDDWSVESVADKVFPVQLTAKDKDFGVSLELRKSKPIVLQGDNGYSIKSDQPGNASYYYSITRMLTVGSISIGGKRFSVTGKSWLDREWSTSRLAPDQVGWDWFALQLDDKREVMFYSLRRDDGSKDIYSAGTIVNKDGTTHKLTSSDVQIEVIRHWKSPHTDILYPSAWKISIPSESLELQVTPAINDQELNLTVRYWEGAVKVSGKYRDNNRIVAGKGYVELAGYKPAPG